MTHPRDQTVVGHRVHHDWVRADGLHQLGDARLVAGEHPWGVLEHRRVGGIDARGFLAAHRVAADEVDALGGRPLHHVRLGARHVRDRLAFGERAEFREKLAHRADRRADDHHVRHLDDAEVGVGGRDDVAVERLAHHEGIAVAPHDDDVRPGLLQRQSEGRSHEAEAHHRDSGQLRRVAFALRRAAVSHRPSGGRTPRSRATAHRPTAPGWALGAPR